MFSLTDIRVIYVLDNSQHSLPGTPSRSRPTSRPPSPTRGASKRPVPGPLLLEKSKSTDPLKAFPTELGQRIFGLLNVRELARCSRVSKKWNRSQTINYGVYYEVCQNTRKFHSLFSVVSTIQKGEFS